MKDKKEKTEILQITQIKIALPGKNIELSSDEARKVYEELGKLFKLEDSNKLKDDIETLKKLFPEKEKEYIPYPVYPRPYPIWIEKDYYPGYDYWRITCGGSANKTTNLPTHPDIINETKFGVPEPWLLSMDLTNNTKG